ncbi:hypothetical protein [Stakelama tenebrarum]|uniref:Uncharacterized protein n=1 Tax=Stakelama tenebrarum TaxID=2711215 RepID=A0A6G6Y2L1_9SPHN|nr:hypothetical protein [Sphingosinithalassobacter tenebrarum]QIG79081.1 hypothetical protein G5C33_04300 [Sphingosinithalassobacter tenebrarum]
MVRRIVAAVLLAGFVVGCGQADEDGVDDLSSAEQHELNQAAAVLDVNGAFDATPPANAQQ